VTISEHDSNGSGAPATAAFASGSSLLHNLAAENPSLVDDREDEPIVVAPVATIAPDPDLPDTAEDAERRVIVLDVEKVKTGAIIAGLLVIALVAAFVLTRRGSDPAVTAAGIPAPTTAKATTPTSKPALAAPTTKAGAPAKPGVPTTLKPAPTTVKPTAPTTAKPTTATTAKPVPTTVAAGPTGTEAFCKGFNDYSLANPIVLGERVIKDPAGHAAAYAAMTKNAPADLKPLVDKLGPLTDKTIAQVKSGALTTPEALRDWLASPAQSALVIDWIGAQQQIVPAAQTLCPA
jgi:hypothetical protein